MSSHGAQNAVELQDIQGALAQAEKPLTAKELSGPLNQKSGKAFKSTLDAEVRAGRIYSWGSDRYWGRNPRAMARERLLNLTKSEVLTAGPLSKRAAAETPEISLPVVRNVRKELVGEKLLRDVAPPPGYKKGNKVVLNVHHPELYLEPKIERLLADFGVGRSKERIQALLAPESDVGEVAEKIFAAMNRIAFAPGTTVTFHRLRQQPEMAQIPKPVFDKAALLLQQERKALLAVHGHAPSLPKEEQDELVTDGLGAYYVSIYAL